MSNNITVDKSKSYLMVTFIDVGWGDSIYIETKDDLGKIYRGLIDSNDSTENNSSQIFLKRYFEKHGFDISDNKPFFIFILLSHDHADHAKGLKGIMRKFGTDNFLYSRSNNLTSLTGLIHYCKRVHINHQYLDSSIRIMPLGDLQFDVVWPLKNYVSTNENNNSIILKLSFFDVSIYLTGDAECEVWNSKALNLEKNAVLLKVPHHGSTNGTFDLARKTPWVDRCTSAALVISSHVRPFEHPDKEVIDLFEKNKREYYRTDINHHISFLTDGKNSQIIYSH